MPNKERAPLVRLTALLVRHHPGIDDPAQLVADGAVLVDGSPVSNPAARVRSDAAIRIRRTKRLRGEIKLSAALATFSLDIERRVALDVGAAAGGFTAALLAAGAARVYAVDHGYGQLLGRLRVDHRVVNLERINLGRLDRTLVPDAIDVVTMDLSYLPVAEAVPQLDRVQVADDADLVALVKPTYELRRATLAREPEQLAAAVRGAGRSLEHCDWTLVDKAPSPLTGTRGAIEVFVHARRSRGR